MSRLFTGRSIASLRLVVNNEASRDSLNADLLRWINVESEFSSKQLSKVAELEAALVKWAGRSGELKLPDLLRRDLQAAATVMGGLRLIVLSAMSASDLVEVIDSGDAA